ncbi:MAG: LemA family protein, partial [Candidatus Limnocylindrales bacterium]
MSPPGLAVLFAFTLVAVIVGYVLVASYNAIVALRQRIDKAWANIDVVLKQRHDQLPNLVAAVRGLMTYERDVLTEVSQARAAYSPTATIPDQAAT